MSAPLTRRIRKALPCPHGQALVLALVMLLVLSVAVLGTVRLGHTVHERIRLQNTADAAAYSMAALEARAFNFYAYSNRTQVSHYVSAMVWHSTLSFLYFSEAFLTDVYGFLRTLNPCHRPGGAFWKVACPLLRAHPGLRAFLSLGGPLLSTLRAFVLAWQEQLRMADPDRLLGRVVIPAHRVLNGAMALASAAVMESSLAEVRSLSAQVLHDNDPEVTPGEEAILPSALSACLFSRVHRPEAGVSPGRVLEPFEGLDPTEVAEASATSRSKRVMGAIANASRFSCDTEGPCPAGGLVTSRTLGELMPLPHWLAPVQAVMSVRHRGQTRLLTHGMARGVDVPRGNMIRNAGEPPGAPAGMQAQADDLGADDVYRLGLRLPLPGRMVNPLECGRVSPWVSCWGAPQAASATSPLESLKASVWAMNPRERNAEGLRFEKSGGVHWRVCYPDGYPAGPGWRAPSGFIERSDAAALGLNRFRACVVPPCAGGLGVSIDKYVANVRPVEDGNHPWPGVMPFPHFEPGHFEAECSTGQRPSATEAATRDGADFNQPSTWVRLTKDLDRLPRAGAGPYATRDTPSRAPLQAVLRVPLLGGGAAAPSSGPKAFADLSPGLNVLARGQAYYHRPGNWNEQPNFFNPYWKPRLAPIGQAREQLPSIATWTQALPVSLRRHPYRLLAH